MVPKANRQWWLAKIESNRRRDEGYGTMLREIGWTVVRVWEHEASATVADRLLEVWEAHG